jgi:DNA-directed RNA polymerase specialized sigma24 family protein
MHDPSSLRVAAETDDASVIANSRHDPEKRLSQGDRDALMLVACADLSYAEAAFALGIPIGTVSSRLNRVRAKLRKSMGHAAKEV